MRVTSFALLCATLLMLGGCAVKPPKFYEDPKEGPTADVKFGQGSAFFAILQSDEDGCAHYERIGHRYYAKLSRFEIKVPVLEPTLMIYDYSMGTVSCSIKFGFIPFPDSVYHIRIADVTKKDPEANAVRRLLGTDQLNYCQVQVKLETPEGLKAAPLFPYELKQKSLPTERSKTADGRPKYCSEAVPVERK